MKTILHILDDNALGGVTRLLASLIGSLSDVGVHHKRVVNSGWRAAPSLRGLLPEGAKPDVIVLHFTAAWRKLPFLASLRARAPGARIIMVEHSYTRSSEQRCVSHPGRFRAMLRLAYGLTDGVVSVSQGQGRWLVEAGLVKPQRLTIIPCVLDLSAFSQVADVEPVEGPMRLGAFGRFAPQKGFDTLIEAMRQISPTVARLELAGYGEDEVDLRRAAEGLAHVRIRGTVDPVAFLGEIDAVAMPSRWEAGGVTCWESRAAGRPIIVSDVDGLPEQFGDDRRFIVPAEDPSALAAAIIALARADRVEIAARGRASTQGAYAATLAGWRKLLADPTA